MSLELTYMTMIIIDISRPKNYKTAYGKSLKTAAEIYVKGVRYFKIVSKGGRSRYCGYFSLF